MEAISLSTFTHLKGETIRKMIEEHGKIDVSIRAKGSSAQHYTVIPGARMAELEALETDMARKRRQERWLEENRDAIAAQNDRIQERGVFGAEFRRF